MKPYYEHAGITIYHGDARDFDITSESVITDPVWPNSVFHDIEDPQLLLTEVRGNGRNKVATEEAVAALPHPTPRKPQHVQWLVKYFGGASVCDPFMGTGTTALACLNARTPYVGIERNEPYCEIAAKRLSQEVMDFGSIA